MEHNPGVLHLVVTDAACIDKQIGQHLDDYLDGQLPPEAAEAVEIHLGVCVACFADVSNQLNIGTLRTTKSSEAEPQELKAFVTGATATSSRTGGWW